MKITVIATDDIHDPTVLSNDADDTSSIDGYEAKEFKEAYEGMNVAGDHVLVIDLSHLARLPMNGLGGESEVPIANFTTFMEWLLTPRDIPTNQSAASKDALQSALLVSEDGFINVDQGQTLNDLHHMVSDYLDHYRWNIGTVQTSRRRYEDGQDPCGPVYLLNINE